METVAHLVGVDHPTAGRFEHEPGIGVDEEMAPAVGVYDSAGADTGASDSGGERGVLVVVAWAHVHRNVEAGKGVRSAVVLCGAAVVSNIAGDHNQVRLGRERGDVVEDRVECLARVVGKPTLGFDPRLEKVGVGQLHDSDDVAPADVAVQFGHRAPRLRLAHINPGRATVDLACGPGAGFRGGRWWCTRPARPPGGRPPTRR